MSTYLAHLPSPAGFGRRTTWANFWPNLSVRESGEVLRLPHLVAQLAPGPPVCFCGAWPLLTIVIWSSKTDELVASALSRARALESELRRRPGRISQVAGGGVGASAATHRGRRATAPCAR